ncbi:MAG: hypothetical protein QM702_19330 [Rubrivivax sp.]
MNVEAAADASILLPMRGRNPAWACRSGLACRSLKAVWVASAVVFVVALALLAALPSPHPDVRLFSDGWGASSFVDEVCAPDGTPISTGAAVLPKPPVVATFPDRFALALRYLAWGLLLPLLLPSAFAARRWRARSPAFVVVLLYGLAPAYFQWAANPAFVELRQLLAGFWLQHWPMDERQFAWLDALAISLWMLLGAGVGWCIWTLVSRFSRLVGGSGSQAVSGLLPLGLVVLFLGLSEPTVAFLRGEGVALDLLPALRLAALLAGGLLSGAYGLRVVLTSGLPLRQAAMALFAWTFPLALGALHGWAMYFHWVSRYRV